jgi:hypothetical protein
MKNIKYFALLGMVAFVLHGCYIDNEEQLYRFSDSNCDTSNVAYSTGIAPILIQNCIVCHSGASASGSPQVTLDNYNGVKVVADNGKLLNVVSYITKPMPPSGKMDYCSLAKIRVWISSGAPHN